MKKWLEILPLFLVRWLISFDGLELVLKNTYKIIYQKEEHKQETLEEVAKRLYQYQSKNPPYTTITPKNKTLL